MFNYIGSKSKLVNFIDTIVEDIDTKKDEIILCDLFAGTGAVGSYFRQKGNYKIIANDMLYCSYVINKHLIEGTEPDIDITLFNHFNNLSGTEGFIYNNFCEPSGRLYFSSENGKKIDAVRIELENLYDKGTINLQTYYYYLSCLLQSVALVSNTAGVYTAYLKKLKKSAQKDFILHPIPIIDGIRGTVYNKNSGLLIDELEGDILYLDPPYNSRQYGNYYHVLETIAKYDSPILKGVTGVRDYERSDFCLKSRVASALDYILKKAKFKHILLSYNNEGLLSFNDIESMMSKYGSYERHTTEYIKYKSQDLVTENNTVTESIHYLVKDFNKKNEGLIGTDKLKKRYKVGLENTISNIDAIGEDMVREIKSTPTFNTDKVKGSIKIDDLKGILVV